MRDNNLPAWPPRVEGSMVKSKLMPDVPINRGAIDNIITRFHAYLRTIAEKRRLSDLIEKFSTFVTDEEARVAAEAIMDYRRRRYPHWPRRY